MPTGELLRQQFAQLAAGHQPRGDLGQRNSGGLGNIRHRARGARIDLNHVDVILALGVALNGELQVDQANHLERQRQFARVAANHVQRFGANAHGGQHTGGVAGVNASLLNVLHDAGDDHVLRVAERIDIHLDGVLQKVIDQHRPLLRILDGFCVMYWRTSTAS